MKPKVTILDLGVSQNADNVSVRTKKKKSPLHLLGIFESLAKIEALLHLGSF